MMDSWKNLRQTIVFPCICLMYMSAAACALPLQISNPTNPIRTVAVLPLLNNTNDVEAPQYVRKKLAEELTKQHYVVKPIAEVDQLLKDQMGLTLGVQLDMVSPQELGKALGVEGVFYGSLEDFSHQATGLYNVKRVRIRTKMINSQTGETVWSNGIGVKSVSGAASGGVSTLALAMNNNAELMPLFGTDIPAQWLDIDDLSPSAFAGGLGFMNGAVMAIGEKVIMKTMKMPLLYETTVAVNQVLTGLPPGPGPLTP